jgi:oxygen-independent coproporphyrinogen III oxidase
MLRFDLRGSDLKEVYFKRMFEAAAPVESVYLHVPFCAHKCEYCAFYSHAPGEGLVDRYVRSLIAELEMVAPARPRTIFFGGGTPSILNMRQWEAILSSMQRLGLSRAEEWTVECNPATVSADKAKLLKDFGVNRISMGVQSLDERLLERLGRIHSREQVFRSFDTLRAAGFENLNIDLMFGIPGQTMEIWRATLKEALDLGSEHLSSYEVIYEQDTPLFEQMKAGEFDVNEDLACDMHEELVSYAGSRGYRQYEVANFARDVPGNASDTPTFACKHNVNYWRGGFYHGFGPSAAGFLPGENGEPPVRTKNWSNTTMYCELIEKGRRPIESSETLSARRRAGEIAAFGLRMNSGWPLDQFMRVTGVELTTQWRAEVEKLVERGWATLEPERFRLTPRGLRFADAAAEEFLETNGVEVVS